MTYKQTMLDGVDVLKEKINICFILLLNKLETSETIEQTIYEHLDVFVEEWSKQLKAKEQECEALQMSKNEAGEIIAELQAYKDVNEDFKTAWEELKAENEELKKIINEAKNSNLDLKSFLVSKAVQNEYEQQLDQLKQTLDEIEEFCIVYSGNHDAYENVYKHILEIINEAKDGE